MQTEMFFLLLFLKNKILKGKHIIHRYLLLNRIGNVDELRHLCEVNFRKKVNEPVYLLVCLENRYSNYGLYGFEH